MRPCDNIQVVVIGMNDNIRVHRAPACHPESSTQSMATISKSASTELRYAVYHNHAATVFLDAAVLFDGELVGELGERLVDAALTRARPERPRQASLQLLQRHLVRSATSECH